MAQEIKITLIKSTIGAIPKQKKTIEALGLKKLGKSVIKQNNEATLGMVKKVSHLVKVEDVV